MNDTIDICRVEGDIRIDGDDIYDKRVDPVQLRAKVGMVFQKPNPFPKSIYDNVAYGPRIHGLAKKQGRSRHHRGTCLAPWCHLGRGQGPPDRPRHPACPVASNSVCASPARLPPNPKSC